MKPMIFKKYRLKKKLKKSARAKYLYEEVRINNNKISFVLRDLTKLTNTDTQQLDMTSLVRESLIKREGEIENCELIGRANDDGYYLFEKESGTTFSDSTKTKDVFENRMKLYSLIESLGYVIYRKQELEYLIMINSF